MLLKLQKALVAMMAMMILVLAMVCCAIAADWQDGVHLIWKDAMRTSLSIMFIISTWWFITKTITIITFFRHVEQPIKPGDVNYGWPPQTEEYPPEYHGRSSRMR